MLNFIVKFSKLLTCLILLSLCVYSSDDHDEKENKRVIPGTPPAAHKKKSPHDLESPDRRKTPLKTRDSAVDSQKPLPLPIPAPVIEERDDDNQSEPDMFNTRGSRKAGQLDDSRLYASSPDLFANMGGTQESLEDEKDPSYHPSESTRSSSNNSGSSLSEDDDGAGHTEESSQHASSEEPNSDEEYESDKASYDVKVESSVEKFSNNALFNLQTAQEKKVVTPEPVQAKEARNIYTPEILPSSPIAPDHATPIPHDFLDEFDGSPSQPSREDTESEEEEDLNGQFNDFSSIQHNTQKNVQGPVAEEDVVVVETDEEPEVSAVNSKPKPRMHGDFVPASALMQAQADQKPQAQVTPKAPVNPWTEMMSTQKRRTVFAPVPTPARRKSVDAQQHQVGWHQSTTGTGNFVLRLESGACGTLMIPKAPGDVFKLAYSGRYPVLNSRTLEEAKREVEKLLPQLEAQKRQADLQEESERALQARIAESEAKKGKFKENHPPK